MKLHARERIELCLAGLIIVALAVLALGLRAFGGEPVSVAWDPSTDTITGYKVHYGPASRFTSSGQPKTNFAYASTNTLGNVTAHTVTNLDNGLWYLAATAYLDVPGARLESPYSNEIIWTNAPAAPTNLRIAGGTGGEVSVKGNVEGPFEIQWATDAAFKDAETLATIHRGGITNFRLKLATDITDRFMRTVVPGTPQFTGALQDMKEALTPR